MVKIILLKFLCLIASLNGFPLGNNEVENNSELTGGYFEGDMILTHEQIQELFEPSKSGLINKKYRWKDRIVPYQLLNKDFGKKN